MNINEELTDFVGFLGWPQQVIMRSILGQIELFCGSIVGKNGKQPGRYFSNFRVVFFLGNF